MRRGKELRERKQKRMMGMKKSQGGGSKERYPDEDGKREMGRCRRGRVIRGGGGGGADGEEKMYYL